MRLALNFQRVDPTRGGAETYVVDLCQHLIQLGHEVDLYAESWREGALPPEVNCIPVAADGRTRTGRIRSFAKNSEKALSEASHDCTVGLINTWHHDVIIPQGGVHRGSLEANAKRFPAGFKRSLYRLGKLANPKFWTYEAIEQKQYDPQRQVRVIAVSNMVKEHLQEYHHLPRSRVHVIPNAIDAGRLQVDHPAANRCAFRNKVGLAPNDLVALFVGHNFALKGLEPLLKALAERKRLDPQGRPVHLLVCGGGKVARFRRMANNLDLADTVHWLGYTPDIRPCFWASDFFVLPTYYDPCSLVVFEALACGLPVITTSCNGAGEVMTDGREGYILTAPDALGEMIGAIDRMTDDAGRQLMSERAMQLGLEQSFDKHVSRLVQVFEDVAGSRTRRTPHGNRATAKKARR
ncbi:UDP-glucose:(heptosyl)LPS alpha-1,3-glucosyltransferase [Singulisphaera sp. GP187]|uniref:glycosyltransferase family 4 protein n=1 Tax=Singulisphaera sp. GP187 TaxID=1882752 RepID=UPI0009263398|nr:glycosyltransferase family 4 protein [Singulisphaera sp. GP187]SIO59363.1 UDP-glucose:(heptosyl)LPS alpha-1,3-glucosyltransferase [Singulisphaera sp. GP187]